MQDSKKNRIEILYDVPDIEDYIIPIRSEISGSQIKNPKEIITDYKIIKTVSSDILNYGISKIVTIDVRMSPSSVVPNKQILIGAGATNVSHTAEIYTITVGASSLNNVLNLCELVVNLK